MSRVIEDGWDFFGSDEDDDVAAAVAAGRGRVELAEDVEYARDVFAWVAWSRSTGSDAAS